MWRGPRDCRRSNMKSWLQSLGVLVTSLAIAAAWHFLLKLLVTEDEAASSGPGCAVPRAPRQKSRAQERSGASRDLTHEQATRKYSSDVLAAPGPALVERRLE